MEEDFKGRVSRGSLVGNKCKNDEKWDAKMKKCVKKTKNSLNFSDNDSQEEILGNSFLWGKLASPIKHLR